MTKYQNTKNIPYVHDDACGKGSVTYGKSKTDGGQIRYILLALGGSARLLGTTLRNYPSYRMRTDDFAYRARDGRICNLALFRSSIMYIHPVCDEGNCFCFCDSPVGIIPVDVSSILKMLKCYTATAPHCRKME
jgi:hypothetical protein